MINTWNETYLHEELKGLYASKHSTLEAQVGASICDILHEDGSVTEIQTSSLGKLKSKIERLIVERKVRLVYPIAETLMIETKEADGSPKSRRKSPKKGIVYQLFPEITSIYHLLEDKNLELEVVFANVTEFRVADGTGSWRRKGIRIENKRLDAVNSTRVFHGPRDFLALLPEGTPSPFTTKDLRALGVGKYAGHMVWVLHKMNLLEKVGTKDRCILYRVQ